MFESDCPHALAFIVKDLIFRPVIAEGSGFKVIPTIERSRLIFEDF